MLANSTQRVEISKFCYPKLMTVKFCLPEKLSAKSALWWILQAGENMPVMWTKVGVFFQSTHLYCKKVQCNVINL